MSRRQWDSWSHGNPPSDQIKSGSYQDLAIFGRVKKEDKLFRKNNNQPGPIKLIDVLTGEEVKTMPKTLKNKPVADEELDDDVEETEDVEEEEDSEETPKAKKGRGNPGNLTPREPVKVPAKVVSGLTPEVQKLLKRREKLLAAGDQKGLRKVRMELRKNGFRLSQYAGKDDLIAKAAKNKEKPAKKAADEDEDDE